MIRSFVIVSDSMFEPYYVDKNKLDHLWNEVKNRLSNECEGSNWKSCCMLLLAWHFVYYKHALSKFGILIV